MNPLQKLIVRFHQAQEAGIVAEITHEKTNTHPQSPTQTIIRFHAHTKLSVIDALCSYLYESFVATNHICNLTSTLCADSDEKYICFYSTWVDGAY